MTHKASQAEVNALLRNDFGVFWRKAVRYLIPGSDLLENWHHDTVSYYLDKVMDDEISYLIINLPPRTLKSKMVSVAWVAFMLGHDPTLTIRCVSHHDGLVVELSNLFRKLVSSAWYKSAFPTMRPEPSKNTELRFVTQQGGGRIGLRVFGDITGSGSDIIIADDTLDASAAGKPHQSAAVNEWFDKTLSTRVNNPAKRKVIIVQQRISLHDLSGHLLARDKYAKLIIPAISEKDTVYPIRKGEQFLFKKGELLQHDHLTQEYLDESREYMGEASFLAQFQQRPVPEGAGIIDTSHFKWFTDLPKTHGYRFLSVDPASGAETGAFSVIQGYVVAGDNIFLAASWRGKWPFPDLCNTIMTLRERFAIKHLVVERDGLGRQVLEELASRMDFEDRYKHLHGMSTKGESKIYRMEQAMVTVRQGRVFIREREWAEPLINELQMFPTGPHNDQVDALSQAIKFVRNFGPPKLNARVTIL